MKKMILIGLILISFNVFAQNDSTTIKFEYIENSDLILMNKLNGIQMITMSCNDTLNINKRFHISIAEFENGEIKDIDSLTLPCEILKIPVVVGGDTTIYEMDKCSHVEYTESEKPFKIKFAGKYQNDSLKLIINYPSIILTTKLKGAENYSLREIVTAGDDYAKIVIGKRTPLLAYTAPFDTGSSFRWYCILDSAKPETWFEKFGVKHFYIIYLEIA
jgi:hypothetical protein